MKKDIKFTKLADVFNLTRQTISTKFKNLISLGLIVDSGVDTYDLIKLDNDVAWLV
jgi:predicted transcriptional regulator